MNAKTVKVVGLVPRRDVTGTPTGYYTYHCTTDIAGDKGVGTAVLTFSSKAEFKIGSSVHVVYVEKSTKNGERFKTWEVINF